MAGRSDVAAMQAFVDGNNLQSIPQVIDLDGSLWGEFDVLSQPAMVFINDDGMVTTHSGSIGASELADELERLKST